MIQVLKIGGKIIEDENLLKKTLNIFHQIKETKILVHGGGNIATKFSKKLGIQTKMINGRRITDSNILDIITMVYAGLINKKIVSILQSLNCNALGLSGIDVNLIKTKKRIDKNINYGYVGDLTNNSINISMLELFINNNIIPIICSLTHNGNGSILNTNADTIASYIAIALSKKKTRKVQLHYAFEKKGVINNLYNNNLYLNKINEKTFLDLKKKKIIKNGMIPKLDNGFFSLKMGVNKVTIGYPIGIIDPNMCTLLF